MNEQQAEIIKKLMENAPVLQTVLIARDKSEDALIDLLVAGFREILERDKDKVVPPDFTDGPINAYSFYLPVIMLLEEDKDA